MFIVWGAVVLASCASLSTTPLNTTETMMWCTYPLASQKVIGTCFLVAVRDPHLPGRYRPVVVTSTHVLKAAGNDPLSIPLRMIGAHGQVFFALVEVGGADKTPPYYVCHPTQDVAAFLLPVPTDLEPLLVVRLLEENHLAGGDSRAGDAVAFLGFPEGLPGSPDLFPVLREGCVASYDPNQLAARLFLINSDVYPGDSGAPVFRVSPKGKPKVVGMVVERLEIREGERSPLALAVDGGVIRETLQLLANRRED